jgi:hypothetical protein
MKGKSGSVLNKIIIHLYILIDSEGVVNVSVLKIIDFSNKKIQIGLSMSALQGKKVADKASLAINSFRKFPR